MLEITLFLSLKKKTKINYISPPARSIENGLFGV